MDLSEKIVDTNNGKCKITLNEIEEIKRII
jgi:hypothetical protein